MGKHQSVKLQVDHRVFQMDKRELSFPGILNRCETYGRNILSMIPSGFCLKVLVFISSSLGINLRAAPLSLEDFMQRLESKSSKFKSIKAQIEAAESKRTLGDYHLSPNMTLKLTKVDDRKPQFFSATMATTRTQATEYSAEISKLFLTGTLVKVNASVGEATITGNLGALSTDFTQGSGSVGVTLVQSLWRGFFGDDLRAKDRRLDRQLSLEQRQLELENRQEMIRYENLFWDWVFLKAQVDSLEQSVERASKLLAWTEKRASNGIGDRGDVLGALGLKRSRELQLSAAQEALEAHLRLLAEDTEWTVTELKSLQPPMEVKFQRSWKQYIPVNWSQVESMKMERMDLQLIRDQVEIQREVVNEAVSGSRPEVNLILGLKNNPNEANLTAASQRLGGSENPTTTIGLQMSFNLDSSYSKASRSQTRALLRSVEFTERKKQAESSRSWEDIREQMQNQKRRIVQLEELNKVQMEKAVVERNEQQRGTSVTSEAINAEQAASDGHLKWMEAWIQLRKLETQLQLYVPVASYSTQEVKP